MENLRRPSCVSSLIGSFTPSSLPLLTSPHSRLLTAATSASQISFYIETGGEVQWMAAGNLAMDPGGLRMILSELPKFSVFILAFSGVAWLIAPRFYALVGRVLHKTGLSFRQMHRCLRGKSQLSGYEQLAGPCDEGVEPR